MRNLNQAGHSRTSAFLVSSPRQALGTLIFIAGLTLLIMEATCTLYQ